ncbi:hypothetical protein JG687_00009635 [Phytophthora cactorum]|uniref:Uncharacterized protein n=1 Tax=Phytophthora cactorum TaxID=29920 RepID=A0A329RQ41_9STRA|nr:hypothetical protein Pcac1_g15649 [Phytophthora cactorum]KAG2811648.1 hypothetical protein PC112_g15514 [Phytophthora cactorum]KAG2813192.1 hypothetical protein PC111_g14504 [Phytophthora cactorum]KAG2851812.1 hypothetical protein PC113_g15590 [Phytophthora cactorum]KAG2891382.1 hypothetical protein PC114_g17024 [Phytophthora cactorum]
MKVYSAPASTAGVERNHKVAKRIHSASRNRTSRGKVEEQVAVAHNSVVLDLEIDSYRQKFEEYIVRNPFGANTETSTTATDMEQDGKTD